MVLAEDPTSLDSLALEELVWPQQLAVEEH